MYNTALRVLLMLIAINQSQLKGCAIALISGISILAVTEPPQL